MPPSSSAKLMELEFPPKELIKIMVPKNGKVWNPNNNPKGNL